MKQAILYAAIAVSMGTLYSCSENEGEYIDLETGKTIKVEKDEKTGAMVNADTKEALYIYVDTKKKDTILAATGEVINGKVVKTDDNKYVYDDGSKLKIENGETKYKDGDYKLEVEKDGDINIKDGDKKVKIDGETGERKVKND
jgi:hypothetical protein